MNEKIQKLSPGGSIRVSKCGPVSFYAERHPNGRRWRLVRETFDGKRTVKVNAWGVWS